MGFLYQWQPVVCADLIAWWVAGGVKPDFAVLGEAIQRFLHGRKVLRFQTLKGEDLLGRVVGTIEGVRDKESPLVCTDIFYKAV